MKDTIYFILSAAIVVLSIAVAFPLWTSGTMSGKPSPTATTATTAWITSIPKAWWKRYGIGWKRTAGPPPSLWAAKAMPFCSG